jgi:primary-amine oxidase
MHTTTGLAKWTAADRGCGPGSDPVVWLAFGVSHIVRTEDFPVMPCETVGFQLKPASFFRYNPGTDLPHDPNVKSKLAAGSSGSGNVAATASGSGCCGVNGSSNGTSNGHAINGHHE